MLSSIRQLQDAASAQEVRHHKKVSEKKKRFFLGTTGFLDDHIDDKFVFLESEFYDLILIIFRSRKWKENLSDFTLV